MIASIAIDIFSLLAGLAVGFLAGEDSGWCACEEYYKPMLDRCRRYDDAKREPIKRIDSFTVVKPKSSPLPKDFGKVKGIDIPGDCLHYPLGCGCKILGIVAAALTEAAENHLLEHPDGSPGC